MIHHHGRNAAAGNVGGGGGGPVFTEGLWRFENNLLDETGQYDGEAVSANYPTGLDGQGFASLNTGYVGGTNYPNGGRVPMNTGLIPLTGRDTTIEYWFKAVYVATTKYLICSGNDRGMNLGCISSGGRKVYIWTNAQGNTKGLRGIQSGTISYGVWYHVAVVFALSEGRHRCYLNGVKFGDAEGTDIWIDTFSSNKGQWLYMGYLASTAIIDEVRISNYARYNENFTPPAYPMVVD